MRALLLTILLFSVAAAAAAQSNSSAKTVYQTSQNSVFLIYLNDSTGAPSALGSAFVVAPHRLITNAHVVAAGNPVLAVGPIRIPVKIIRRDLVNDLALLSVDADLTNPLLLSTDKAAPGETVFAIGNPEGLEKTISQGLISGVRTIDHKTLLQITSPISHGSSGGPILNEKSEVVGVAVGMLEDGQNLNFAVPVNYVRDLLEEKTDMVEASSISPQLPAEIRRIFLKRNQDEYSDNASSPYQQDTKQLLDLMTSTVSGSKNESALSDMACLGTESLDLSDLGIEAARRLLRLNASPESRALLSYTLLDHAGNQSFIALISPESSNDKAQALAAHDQFLSEAEHEALQAISDAKGRRLLVATYVLGSVRDQQKNYAAAISLHQAIVTAKPKICETELAISAYRSLISENDQLNRPSDSEKWFKEFASQYPPSPSDWDAEGDRRSGAQDLKSAAIAYEHAASDSTSYAYDYCYAAWDRYAEPATEADEVLSDGRKCIDASVKNTNKSDEAQFAHELPAAYRAMATVLNDRGVYQPSLEYIKEALAAKPDDSFALNIEASIYENLERYSECIAAAQAAISASDGKYASMHFRLGSCYFQISEWSKAETNFRIAANADKDDAVSAFDLGLSLQRQGFIADARQWFTEALNRKPDSELRIKIINALR